MPRRLGRKTTRLVPQPPGREAETEGEKWAGSPHEGLGRRSVRAPLIHWPSWDGGWDVTSRDQSKASKSDFFDSTKLVFCVKHLYNSRVDHISAHIKGTVPKKERLTERGELMEYFRTQLNHSRVRDGLLPLSMPRMGRLLQAIPTKDLYYLKSVCDQAKDFSKKFWWEIKPKQHEK